MRLGLAALLLFAGCATTLVKEDIRRQSDQWTVVFHELTDGPNGFTTRGAISVSPASGDRFLWVVLSVKNEGASAREFPFASCALDLGAEGASLPLYVGMNLGTSAETSTTPTLDPGEEITRKLAYGYPEGQFPTKLVCFGNEIPLRRK